MEGDNNSRASSDVSKKRRRSCVSIAGLPKSFSSSSLRNDDEFAELVRAASQRSKSSPISQQKAIPKSFNSFAAPSVGRIDEGSPCYFGGSFKKNAAQPDLRFPARTRSCHPGRTSFLPAK
ncbi:hypothetical protein SUGI_0559120 [Cryptomeria japonica]|nr:hypothetical protein SUGI_0559120 [Cryptomeria japonica]